MHEAPRGLTATERWTIRLAPALGVAAVTATALLFTESEARWALVYAGPTDQPETLVWRIAVKQGGATQALPTGSEGVMRVNWGNGHSAESRFQTDADALGWVTLRRPSQTVAAPMTAEVTFDGRVLAKGPVNVPRPRWAAGERIDGGWCMGFHEGPVGIRLGIIDGILLHGYPSAALIELTREGQPLANQAIRVEADGAKIVGTRDVSQLMLVTDARGLVHLNVRATDMAATLSVKVLEPVPSRLTVALPVRTGGMRAVRRGSELIINTSVEAESVWFGLLTQNGLAQVQKLPLRASGNQWTASTSISDWPKPPLWAVVSREPELQSTNTIGWPLTDESDRDAAHVTRIVPNVLALDGKPVVHARLHRQRQRVLLVSSSALLVVAALVTWVVLRTNRRHQRQVRALSAIIGDDTRQETAMRANTPVLADRTPLALIAISVTTAAVVALAFWFAIGLL